MSSNLNQWQKPYAWGSTSSVFYCLACWKHLQEKISGCFRQHDITSLHVRSKVKHNVTFRSCGKCCNRLTSTLTLWALRRHDAFKCSLFSAESLKNALRFCCSKGIAHRRSYCETGEEVSCVAVIVPKTSSTHSTVRVLTAVLKSVKVNLETLKNLQANVLIFTHKESKTSRDTQFICENKSLLFSSFWHFMSQVHERPFLSQNSAKIRLTSVDHRKWRVQFGLQIIQVRSSPALPPPNDRQRPLTLY